MKKKRYKKNQIIKSYVSNNIKEILTISMIFIIGIVCGIMLINNIKDERENRNPKLHKSIF